MPSIFVEIEVPRVLQEYFIKYDFNPFERLILSYKLDTDESVKLVQQLMTEIRYQKQRDEKTKSDIRKMD